MKPRYFSMLVAGVLLASMTDGCSMTQTVEQRVGEEVLNESEVYRCSPDETAGMVPHQPNEMHCCMTEVEENTHNKAFVFAGSASDQLEIGGEVPNYIKAELKAAGRLTFGVDGTLVRSFHAKHAPEAHCSTHTGTDQGQCKPKYVRSRYDLEGKMVVGSEREISFGSVLLGIVGELLPIKLSLGSDNKSVLVEQEMSLCVEADHTDAECSPPVACQGDGGPGCALTDAGTEAGSQDGAVPTDGGTSSVCAPSSDGCNNCMHGQCCAALEACAANASCKAALATFESCSGDQVACAEIFGVAGGELANNAVGCMFQNCESACTQ